MNTQQSVCNEHNTSDTITVHQIVCVHFFIQESGNQDETTVQITMYNH